jgi:hypothetical protein
MGRDRDNMVSAKIGTETDLTGLEDAVVYVGDRLNADEMHSTGRYRVTNTVPKQAWHCSSSAGTTQIRSAKPHAHHTKATRPCVTGQS